MLCLLCKYPNVYLNRESSAVLKLARCFSNALLPESQPVSPHQVTAENQHESLAHAVTPLWQIPYSKQLDIKLEWSKAVIQNFTKKFQHQVKERKTRRVPYKIHPVKPSDYDAISWLNPVTKEYRNKDEFSIQRGVDGNPKTVGFFVGSPAEGAVVCVRGTHLVNLRESHNKVAEAFEEYIRSSPLPACLHFADGGHWRGLTVRSNKEGQLMAIVLFHPQSMAQEKLEEEADKIRDFFLHGPGTRCNLSSLYFQPCRHTRCTADQAPYSLLLGDSHLTEKLSGFSFCISPDSFFQVNTAAASVLYEVVLNLAHVTPRTTLLDVCCGTGTVSILASSRVRGAVGVESVHSAVADAKHNAVLNKASNVEFIPGLAEKKIPKLISELGLASDIVAVLNPGRSGLHARVVKALCRCHQIRRLVYVSCKADSPNTVSNFIQLCSEGKFSLRDVVPVDLFPHTMHTELVMSFRR